VDRSRDLPGVRAFSLDGTVYADAGASDARELGWTTAVGVAVLRALVNHGLTVDEALDQIAFTWSADADQFRTICRLRAARRIWARVAEASGATDQHWGQVQHASGSTVDITRRDPWSNLLRGTVAAFAAGVGGADSVTVLPFDSALGRPDEFGRRTARSTQLLLLEESALASVVDPAGGSWYVEDLTRRMAEVAWERFHDIEAVGGANAALTSGLMEAEAAACWTARRARLVTRVEVVTGVSEFPDLEEIPVERPAAMPASTGPLPLRRRSEPFEALRDAADAFAEVPTMRLVTMGSLVDYNARSTFATNLYAVAGIRALPGADGGSSVAVVCGSDDSYVRDGVAVVTGLRDEGVTRVHLAAHPGALDDDTVTALRDAGVDQFVHAGVNVVDLLERTLADLSAGLVLGMRPDGDGTVSA
jgi:methylmalonyl-CoA mutase